MMTIQISKSNMVRMWEHTDPSPTFVTAYSVHLSDSGGQQTAERTSECCGGEEQGGTETKFLALVPAAVALLA